MHTLASTPPTLWHEIKGRHRWLVRVHHDSVPDKEGWFWEAYTHSPTRHVAMESRLQLDKYPENMRWPAAREALEAARDYLLQWESERPDF